MSEYKIISLKKTEAPNTAVIQSWYQFIVENDNNRIVGFRSGKPEEVKSFLQETIDRLNKKYSVVSSVKKAYLKTVTHPTFYDTGENL